MPGLISNLQVVDRTLLSQGHASDPAMLLITYEQRQQAMCKAFDFIILKKMVVNKSWITFQQNKTFDYYYIQRSKLCTFLFIAQNLQSDADGGRT